MSDRVSLKDQTTELKRDDSPIHVKKSAPSSKADSPHEHIASLQQTIGNRALYSLFKAGTLQAKLKISQPNDIYEQEADRVADQVTSMPDSEIQAKSTWPLKQDPSCRDSELVQQKISDQITPITQGKVASPASEVTPEVQSRVESLNGGGQPLPESERAYFEPRFGHNFSAVRVYADAKAAESARAVNARAYTVGKDVVFGSGEFDSGSSEGRRLMAHELTHVMQQAETSAYSVQRATPDDSKADPEGTILKHANTTLELLSQKLADTDASGWAGITFMITNTGTELESGWHLHEPQKVPTVARAPLTKISAASHIQPVIDQILISGSGIWQLNFARTGDGPLEFKSIYKVQGMPTMEATSSPLSPQPKITLEEEMQHMVDPELPPESPSDRMAPESKLDPDHQEKVLRVIRWAMNESIAKHVDQKTGAVDATRYDILEDAHRYVINKLRENPAIPNSSINLIYRDADHYLVARRGMSDFVKYPTNPELRASLTPFVFMFYDVTKGLGHAAEAITGERWTPLRSNRDFPAAQPGGAEWALLGVRHFLKWDKSRMEKKEIPELPEETAAERLFKAIEDAYGSEATGVDQTATNMDEKRASLRLKK